MLLNEAIGRQDLIFTVTRRLRMGWKYIDRDLHKVTRNMQSRFGAQIAGEVNKSEVLTEWNTTFQEVSTPRVLIR